jgi:hypothetical protein
MSAYAPSTASTTAAIFDQDDRLFMETNSTYKKRKIEIGTVTIQLYVTETAGVTLISETPVVALDTLRSYLTEKQKKEAERLLEQNYPALSVKEILDMTSFTDMFYHLSCAESLDYDIDEDSTDASESWEGHDVNPERAMEVACRNFLSKRYPQLFEYLKLYKV